MNYYFQKADLNKDGVISREEAGIFIKNYMLQSSKTLYQDPLFTFEDENDKQKRDEYEGKGSNKDVKNLSAADFGF